MRKSVAPLLLRTVVSERQRAASAATAIPPILTGSPTAAQINQRCNWFVARSTALRTALETSKGKPSVATTLAAYRQAQRS